MTVGTSIVEANGLNDAVAVPSDALDGSAGVAEKTPNVGGINVPPGLPTFGVSDDLPFQALKSKTYQ